MGIYQQDFQDKNKERNLALFQTSATQPTITCSKLTIEILKQGVKYVQS